MAASSNLFFDLLVEEYKNRTQNMDLDVDVVGTKRKNFETMLNMAHNDLRKQNFADAKQKYYDVLDYLENEPYHDELNLLSEEEFCIKCCFSYSSLMDSACFQEKTVINILTEQLVKALQEEYSYRLFPKYLLVLLSFKRKDWVMTLYWCNVVGTHKEDEEASYKSLDFFEELLPTQSEINDKVKIYEKESFYGYGRKLLNILWCTKKTEDSFPSECNECMRTKVKQYILKDYPPMKDTKIKFERFLNKFVELYERISKCSYIDSIENCINDKIAEIENLMPPKKKKEKKSDEKLVQENLESQVLNTLLDIKNNLLVSQETKEDTVQKLNKKISRLQEKLVKETNKTHDATKKLNNKIFQFQDKSTKEANKRHAAEEEFQRKLAKHQFEIKTLKEQLNKSDNEWKKVCDTNTSLQKLLLEQINDKFNIQKNIYKTFEKKSVFMVNYLKEINQFVTPHSIPNDIVVKQNIDIWDRHLNNIQEDLRQLNIVYKKVREDMINTDQFNATWPEMPEFPKDEDNIIFVSFKPAIKNIIDIEEKLLNKIKGNNQVQSQPIQMLQTIRYNVPQPQYPVQHSSFFVGPSLVYPNLPPPMSLSPNKPPHQNPTFSQEIGPGDVHVRQQSCAEQKPKSDKKVRKSKSTEFINKTSDKEIEISAGSGENCVENLKAGASSCNGISNDRNYQEREKILFEYVFDNCSGATEEDVTLAMLHVLDENKGTLSKLSKEQIVQEVKVVLRMKKQTAWVAPKSPHVDWKNDHSEHNCSICFEEFSVGESYTLPCQHKYHKECIKKWLKTSSVCPICRIHSVIDDEFPPLH